MSNNVTETMQPGSPCVDNGPDFESGLRWPFIGSIPGTNNDQVITSEQVNGMVVANRVSPPSLHQMGVVLGSHEVLRLAIKNAPCEPGCRSRSLVRPVMPSFSRPTCRSFHTGCGRCQKCTWLTENHPTRGQCDCWKSRIIGL